MLSIRDQYKMAYRHYRIKSNTDDEGWYWLVNEKYALPVNELEKVDFFSEGILHLNPIALGNAIKSLELKDQDDSYLQGFLYRLYDIVGWERYEIIMKAKYPDHQ